MNTITTLLDKLADLIEVIAPALIPTNPTLNRRAIPVKVVTAKAVAKK
jgi:hypothetical protein